MLAVCNVSLKAVSQEVGFKSMFCFVLFPLNVYTENGRVCVLYPGRFEWRVKKSRRILFISLLIYIFFTFYLTNRRLRTEWIKFACKFFPLSESLAFPSAHLFANGTARKWSKANDGRLAKVISIHSPVRKTRRKWINEKVENLQWI